MTITEFIISSQIRIDFDKGYSSHVEEPEPGIKAARVELDLRPTPLLTRMANLERKKDGLAPIKMDDYCPGCQEERKFRFTCDLNENEPCRVDLFILLEVCDPDAEDFGQLYTIDLSLEEQKVLYSVLCKQLKKIGKTSTDLFCEAWEREKDEKTPKSMAY